VNPPRKAIVLVDDEKSYVDLLANMLAENLACPVFAYTRPREALAAIPSLDVAAVVTDYHMPQMDGFEFIRHASLLLPNVPFILISGHSLHLDGHEFKPDAPLRAILSKPFGWRRLAEELGAHVPELRTISDQSKTNHSSV
jgi:CheY-like chemotaxis protein